MGCDAFTINTVSTYNKDGLHCNYAIFVTNQQVPPNKVLALWYMLTVNNPMFKSTCNCLVYGNMQYKIFMTSALLEGF